jgi:DNA-binding LacI/PurR family transcriptional regulator
VENLPKRTSLVHETASTLKQWISTGVFRDALPGEREVKARLGVGRDTLRLALSSLEQEGWVSPAAWGQHRRILNGHHQAHRCSTRDQLPVTFLSPAGIVQKITLLHLEELRASLVGQGRHLHFLSPDIFQLQKPDRQLERLTRKHPSAAWVLYMAGEGMQRWFEQKGIPALLYGPPFPGVNLPFITSDVEAAAFHAGVQLTRKGHEVIGVLQHYEQFPGLITVERGLHKAITAGGNRSRLVLFKDDFSPSSVVRSLELVFDLKQRPTALVLTRAFQLLTCLSWLASRKISVPGDISIVCLANDSWFTEFDPPISYYRSNTKTIARHLRQRVLELIETGRVTGKSLHVQLEYVPGATVGTAASVV